MFDDRVSQLSMGIAVIMAGHGALAWLGLVKGPVWPNFLAAVLVAGYAIFKKR